MPRGGPPLPQREVVPVGTSINSPRAQPTLGHIQGGRGCGREIKPCPASCGIWLGVNHGLHSASIGLFHSALGADPGTRPAPPRCWRLRALVLMALATSVPASRPTSLAVRHPAHQCFQSRSPPRIRGTHGGLVLGRRPAPAGRHGGWWCPGCHISGRGRQPHWHRPQRTPRRRVRPPTR